nr:MAG TPA: hypothetical protein [Caudoviricetes sp.]
MQCFVFISWTCRFVSGFVCLKKKQLMRIKQ